MKKLKKRDSIIIILAILILAIAVGYAALSQTLTINGTANITTDWKVIITQIAASSSNETNGATDKVTPTYTDTTATFNVDLAYPGATASYVITVENQGNIDALLDSIEGVTEANSAEPTPLSYEVTGITEGSTLSAAGTVDVTVTVTWDADDTTIPEVKTKTATITLNYIQAD